MILCKAKLRLTKNTEYERYRCFKIDCRIYRIEAEVQAKKQPCVSIDRSNAIHSASCANLSSTALLYGDSLTGK